LSFNGHVILAQNSSIASSYWSRLVPANKLDVAIRVLACQRCGGPVQALPAGGTFPCAFCGALLVLAPRARHALGAPTLPEPERLKLLSTQVSVDHSRGVTEFSHFVRDGLHDPAFLDEALAVWNELRAKLQVTVDSDAVDRFFVFTKVVADQLPDAERKRAVLETAVETLPNASDRHVMYARLARVAINEGELDAARAWLALCDTHSIVIEADTELRIALARLALAERDYPTVLEHLGPRDGALPIHDRGRMLAAVYRAHAYESLGDLATATSELTLQAKRSASRLRTIAGDFCPETLPDVLSNHP
jgi:hypothetical protein